MLVTTNMNTVFSNFHSNFIISAVPPSDIADKILHSKIEKEKIKITPLLGSIAGVGISSAYVISKTPKSFNLLNQILKTDFAASKNIFIIATAAILSGFAAGLIKDKEKNKWQKIKEVNFQLLSNVAFPLLFLNLFKSVSAKVTKNANKTIKNISNFVSVFGGVAIGAFSGSAVAQRINDKIHPEEKYNRKLGVKDFLIHIDDLPIALAFAGIPYVDKLIPFILTSRGYDAGKQ